MTLEARMAIEALRAGVPNRAAIRQMGTEQSGIEHAFDAALSAAWADAVPARAGMALAGLGIAGGFGTGKSHLLGYLAEVARQQGFVVSRVVVSKETPLSHPRHVLAAALRDAALPDRPDDPIAACVTILREQPEALAAMEFRRRHARCRVRPDLYRLPVPCPPCVHTTRDAAPNRARLVRRQGEHLGHPPGAGRGRGQQDVSAQGSPCRGADVATRPLRVAAIPRCRLRRLVHPARRDRADRPLHAVAARHVLCRSRRLARRGW